MNPLIGSIRILDSNFEFIFDLDGEKLWSVKNAQDVSVFAERRDKTIIDKNIEDVLNEYPPSLALPNGSIIVGRNKVIPNTSIEDLPDEIWKVKGWGGCNIRSEAYNENAIGNVPVINHTIELLRPSLVEEDIIFLDDGAHEIADLIYFDTSNSTIHFIHCKYSGKDNPGCRKSDCDELFAQAMRSIHWISSPILLDRLNSRLANAKNSQIVFGTEEIFDTLSQNYRVNNWKFNIILVQPGFRLSKASDKNRANNNIYEFAIPLYERIIGSNGTLEIWGN
jgi:hypothetical protein